MEVTFGIVGGYILFGLSLGGTMCAYLYYKAKLTLKRDVTIKSLELFREGYTKEEIKLIVDYVMKGY